MSAKNLSGVIAAVVTPVGEDGSPNLNEFGKVAQHLLSSGCDGLNVLGTTGEAMSFSLGQRRSIMNHAALIGLPLDRLMVGTGASAVEEAVELTMSAAELGFAGALVLPPFYYKDVTDQGIVRYFERIIRNLRKPIPIYLYNFPALSGVPYRLSLVERLIKEFGDTVVGLKDSSGDMGYAKSIRKAFPQLAVFPSSEAMLASARSGEFAGCISATANVNASYCARALHENDDSALKTAVEIRGLFSGKQLVPGIKALLAHILKRESIAPVLPPLNRWNRSEEAELFRLYNLSVSRQSSTII